MVHFAGPENGVDFGDFLSQFVSVPLGEATSHDKTRAVTVLFQLRHLQDGIDRLLLGFVDERAGVHDQYVGARRIVGQLVAGIAGHTQHHLAIDEVFRAA